MRPDWFPDWGDSICAIVGGGPSVAHDDVEQLRGIAKVMVINRSHELAPWADALYAADRRFWDVFGGVKEFAGLKVTTDRDVAKHFRLHLVGLVEQGSSLESSISAEPGILARGGHSGHQALNLALQFGAHRVMLLGFDFVGEHWHGRHEPPLRNPQAATLEKWSRRLDVLAPKIRSLGIEVVNCSQISMLTAYPKMSVAEALAKLSEISTLPENSLTERVQRARLEMTSAAVPPA